jgi:hypothetical protein
VDALVHAAVKARGGTYDAAHQFATLSREAGLRLLNQRGFLAAAEPLVLLDLSGSPAISSIGSSRHSRHHGARDSASASHAREGKGC